MASNKIPHFPIERLFAASEDMADGAASHGTDIGLVQNTETTILADLTAAQNAESAFQAARSDKKAKSSLLQTADSNAKFFIAATKKILSLTLGEKWNADWAAAGWNSPTLAVPKSPEKRLGFIPLIKAYLIANPAKENSIAGVTAANATTIHAALNTAMSAVNTAITVSGQAKALRNAAVEKLRARLSGLVGELTQLIDGDDPRWYAFGLNRPDDSSIPAIVSSLVATPSGPGVLLLDWPDARRAERYKVEIQLPGQADFTEATQVTESEATLTNLPSGQSIAIRVLSANEAGYAQPSEELTVMVP